MQLSSLLPILSSSFINTRILGPGQNWLSLPRSRHSQKPTKLVATQPRRFLEVSYPTFTVVIKDSDTWWLYQVEAFSAFMSLVLSWSKILVESSYSKRLVRMVPHSLLQDPDQPLSAVRDELPYMDTDIARGLVSWLGSSVAKAPRFVNSLVKKGAPFMEESRSWENSKRHPKLSRINQSSFSTSHQTFRFWQLKITNFGPFFLVQAEIRT